MSRLIDELVNDERMKSTQQAVGDGWYIGKSTPYPLMLNSYSMRVIRDRFADAWRVLTGKSCAYHFKIDEAGQ